jgi:hypothetical protein
MMRSRRAAQIPVCSDLYDELAVTPFEHCDLLLNRPGLDDIQQPLGWQQGARDASG